MLAHELRNARIGLGDERNACRLGRHTKNAHHEVRGTNAAVGAKRYRGRREFLGEVDQGCRSDAHHGAARSIEAGGEGVGNAYVARCHCRSTNLFERGHGLNPGNIGAAVLQALHLLREHGDGQFLGQFAQRLEQVTGGAYRSGNDDRPAGGISHGARVLSREAVDFQRAALQAMQHEATGVTAESVGEDDVGPSVHEALVQRLYPLRMLEVPSLGCIA